MPFFLLPFVCFGLYLTIKYWLVPVVEGQQPVTPSRKIMQAVGLSMIGTLNALLLLATITYGFFSVIFLAMRLVAGVGSLSWVQALLGFSNSVYSGLKLLDDEPYYKYFPFGVLVIAFAAALYRSYRKKHSEAFLTEARQVATALAGDHSAYSALPPNEEMEALQQKYQEGVTVLDALLTEAGTNPPEALAAQIEQVKTFLNQVAEAIYRADVFRRVNLADTRPAQKSLWSDISVFLSSRGLINTVNNLTGSVAKLSAMGLMLSLVTLQTLQGSRAIADNLSEVYLEKRLDESRLSFETTVAANAGGREITAEDEQVLDEMAADYELLFANSVFNSSTTYDSSAFRMQSLVVRDQILSAFVSSAHSSDNQTVEAQPDLADSSSFDNTYVQQNNDFQFVRAYTRLERGQVLSPSTRGTRPARWRQPKTAAGKAFQTRLRNEFATQSDVLWQKAKINWTAYKTSFHEPIPIHDLRSMLFAEAAGKFMEPDLKPVNDPFINKIVSDLANDAQSDCIKKAHDALNTEFMDRLAKGESYGEIINSFKNRRPAEVVGSIHRATVIQRNVPSFSASSVAYVSEHHPPSLRLTDRTINRAAAETALRNLNGGTLDEGAIASLNAYEDIFPGQVGSESRTIAGQVRQTITESGLNESNLDMTSSGGDATPSGSGGGAGGGGSGSDSREVRSGKNTASRRATTGRSRTAFNRSRSFARLRGFSRIGGVLIGNEPTNSSQSARQTGADFVGLTWQEANDNFDLSLRHRDGSTISVGSFPRSLVRQTLAYVADGRPTTVTMISVKPISQLKILLHPALVNSQLGLTAMDLDRLVDSFQSPEIEQARQQVQLWGGLYRTAFIERSLSAFGALQLTPGQLIEFRSVQNQNWEQLASLWTTLRAVTPLNNPDAFPFKAKAAYFDQRLVGTIARLIKTSPNFSAFKQRLISSFEGYVAVDSENQSLMPANFEVWSGVREQNYQVSKSLDFLKPDKGRPQYPLDFMVQVAFTSIPQAEQSAEDIIDETPWQFPALATANRVNGAVMKGIRNQNTYSQAVQKMQQFTQLQRIFRLAFSGKLGYDFPLDQLLLLFRATNGAIPFVETPQWNQNPNAFLADQMRSMQSPDFARLVSVLGVYRGQK